MFVVLWGRVAKTDPVGLEYGVESAKKTPVITAVTESFRSNLGYEGEPGASPGTNSCVLARWAPRVVNSVNH